MTIELSISNGTCIIILHYGANPSGACIYQSPLHVVQACIHLVHAPLHVATPLYAHSINTTSPPIIFHTSSYYVLPFFFNLFFFIMSSYICPYIHKRNVDLIYSAVKPPMKIRLWNIDSLNILIGS